MFFSCRTILTQRNEMWWCVRLHIILQANQLRQKIPIIHQYHSYDLRFNFFFYIQSNFLTINTNHEQNKPVTWDSFHFENGLRSLKHEIAFFLLIFRNEMYVASVLFSFQSIKRWLEMIFLCTFNWFQSLFDCDVIYFSIFCFDCSKRTHIDDD